MKKPSIVVWCGSAPNQRALVNKIATEFEVAGIVIEERDARKKKYNWTRLPAQIIDRLRFRSLYGSWKSLMQHYRNVYPSWPPVSTMKVNAINQPGVVDFTTAFQPDLIVVSGTSIIKEPLLSVKAGIGIINLHTGLSPYVKGGPNCTNWCIANNEWHLVGNTIMWLNAGIDSGNIIASECININDTPNLGAAQLKVMEHAHDLYIRSIKYLLSANPPYTSVAQKELGAGQLYLTKMWTARRRQQLLRNWKNRRSHSPLKPPRTIQLPK